MEKTFNLTHEVWNIKNYLAKRQITDPGIQDIIIQGFLQKQSQVLPYKEGIQYVRANFGLFCQYANNSKQQLDNMIKRSEG